MRKLFLSLLCNAFFIPAAFGVSCENLANMPLANAKVTLAATMPAGWAIPNVDLPQPTLPAFCRVSATLMPSSDSSIRIEVWMPVTGWNGKYEGAGNGGYGGSIPYRELAAGLAGGFAVAETDMGTAPTSGENADVLIGHPEKWRDWGSRSTHEMTVAAKQIVHAYYGREPEYSYFVGCSTGGQQALVEAQRFPEDYDGIVAGAPANNRTRLHMGILWNFAVAESDPASYLPAVKLHLIFESQLKACAAQKAVPTDGFLSNPADCKWDPESLLCKTKAGADCLTAQQVAAARKVYQGPRNPVTNALIYPGATRGSELDWGYLMPEGGQPRFDSLFKWTFGSSWDWRSFDFNRDVASVDAALAPLVNATDPDLRAFKSSGHKLISFHGWADSLVPALESPLYYREVEAAQEADAELHHRSEDEEAQSFYRLFMVPGMFHCGGGPGLNSIDVFPALEQWVEHGVQPMQITAERVLNGAPVMTRPVCPYPQEARYNGTGNPDRAESFTCAGDAHQDR